MQCNHRQAEGLQASQDLKLHLRIDYLGCFWVKSPVTTPFGVLCVSFLCVRLAFGQRTPATCQRLRAHASGFQQNIAIVRRAVCNRMLQCMHD